MARIFDNSRMGRGVWQIMFIMVILVSIALVSCPHFAHAQTFDSGSDGSDGALDLITPGTIDFDPVVLGLDPDGDNIYHFTTINIGADVTVRMSARYLNGPVFWLASGAVQIDGIIDLNGEAGQNGQDILNASFRVPSVAGAGGFGGGVGGAEGVSGSGNSLPQSGSGPGKGGTSNRGGGGAGHATAGGDSTNTGGNSCAGAGGGAGQSYGSIFIVPLMSGSGGAGGLLSGSSNGGGGGAGGGSLLIASSTSITVSGTIQANGGRGGNSSVYAGGGGSGGSIRLVSPTISGTGTISAAGGGGGTGKTWSNVFCNGAWRSNRGHGGAGSKGRIRLEAFQHQFTGTTDPVPPLASPFGLFLPTTTAPALRVVSVAGIPIQNPTASLTLPDVTIDTNETIEVGIEASNIPVGTVAQLHIVSENAPDQVIDSTPLAGTEALSTANVTVTLPSGFSRGYVHATWPAATP